MLITKRISIESKSNWIKSSTSKSKLFKNNKINTLRIFLKLKLLKINLKTLIIHKHDFTLYKQPLMIQTKVHSHLQSILGMLPRTRL